MENIAIKIIKKFNLPVRMFYVDKTIHGEFIKNEN